MAESGDNVVDFTAAQVSLVRCDGCGAEWNDIEAATHQDGFSDGRCPNKCGRLTTPVYWPAEHGDKWERIDDV
jgi:hypothetical protein